MLPHFVSKLQFFAGHSFKSTLEDILRDRIVYSINDPTIQQLVGETKLTFEKAMSTAQAMETATRNNKKLCNLPRSAVRLALINVPQVHKVIQQAKTEDVTVL